MGFMDNVMGSFNDEAGKINTGTGQYRVMQVVLREKFVGKGRRTSPKSRSFATSSTPKATAFTRSRSRRRDPPASAAAIEPCATSCSSA